MNCPERLVPDAHIDEREPPAEHRFPNPRAAEIKDGDYGFVLAALAVATRRGEAVVNSFEAADPGAAMGVADVALAVDDTVPCDYHATHIPTRQQRLMPAPAVQCRVTLSWPVARQWRDHRVVLWISATQQLAVDDEVTAAAQIERPRQKRLPRLEDYREAAVRPARAFSDALLQRCRVEGAAITLGGPWR